MPAVIEFSNPDDLCQRYEAGETPNELAKCLGVSRTAIRNLLIRRGLKLHTMSEVLLRRNASLGPAERLRRVSAAHDAIRGKTRPDQELIKRARTIQDIREPTPIEALMIGLIEARGFDCVPQKAVGRYNVDIAIEESRVAVEIFGGHWHAGGRHARRHRQRCDYILDSRWALIIVWVTRDYPIDVGAVDQIITLCEGRRRAQPKRRQEIVIRGDGKPTAIGQQNFEGGSTINTLVSRRNSRGQYTSPLKKAIGMKRRVGRV